MLSFQIHHDSQLKIWWKVYLFPLYLNPTKTTETVPCTAIVVGVTPCDWNIKLSENHFNVTKKLKTSWNICGISFINLQQGWTKPMKDITHPFHPYPTWNVQDLSPSHLRVSNIGTLKSYWFPMKLLLELFLELSNCKTYLNLWKLQVDWDQFQFHLSELGKVFLCEDQIEGSVVVRGSKK